MASNSVRPSSCVFCDLRGFLYLTYDAMIRIPTGCWFHQFLSRSSALPAALDITFSQTIFNFYIIGSTTHSKRFLIPLPPALASSLAKCISILTMSESTQTTPEGEQLPHQQSVPQTRSLHKHMADYYLHPQSSGPSALPLLILSAIMFS